MEIKEKLLEMSKEKLVDMVMKAVDLLPEDDKIDFVSKNIDAKTALSYIGENDSGAFLKKVKKFCKECAQGKYYVDESDIYDYNYYDNGYDEAYDELFADSEWVKKFTEYFMLADIYFNSGDYKTAYEAFDSLIECVNTVSEDYDCLGTEDPIAYIDSDFFEIFTKYIQLIFNYIEDEKAAINKVFWLWLQYPGYCAEGFSKYVPNVKTAEKLIFKDMKSEEWPTQNKLYKLLLEMYEKNNITFDNHEILADFAKIQPKFYIYIIDKYYSDSNWEMVLKYCKTAVNLLSQTKEEHGDREILNSINLKQVSAYENLSDYKGAFAIVKNMLERSQKYELYIKARELAGKFMDVSEFIRDFLKGRNLRNLDEYRTDLLLKILSYEGAVDVLINLAGLKPIKNNYYIRKYIAKSLVFRAFYNVNDLGINLTEYKKHMSEDGINDMLHENFDVSFRERMLNSAIAILKSMTEFHIEGADRSRYKKAAYYCSVISDIYSFLGNEQGFNIYYKEIFAKNNRRPALKDEMISKLGKPQELQENKVENILLEQEEFF